MGIDLIVIKLSGPLSYEKWRSRGQVSFETTYIYKDIRARGSISIKILE
jgi:hypothetical protein